MLAASDRTSRSRPELLTSSVLAAASIFIPVTAIMSILTDRCCCWARSDPPLLGRGLIILRLMWAPNTYNHQYITEQIKVTLGNYSTTFFPTVDSSVNRVLPSSTSF